MALVGVTYRVLQHQPHRFAVEVNEFRQWRTVDEFSVVSQFEKRRKLAGALQEWVGFRSALLTILAHCLQ